MKRIIVLAGLSVIVSHSLSRQAYPVLLTAIRDDLLGGSNQRAGFLVTVTFLAYMVGVATMTIVSGRTEPRSTLLVGLWLSSSGFAVLALAHQFSSLAAGLGLAGLGSAGIWMSVPAIATGAVSPERRGVVMGAMSSSMGIGLVVLGQGVRLVRQAAGDQTVWRPIWVVAALFALVLSALVALFLRTEPTERQSTSLSLSVLRQVDGWVPLTIAYVLFGMLASSYAPFLGAKLTDDGFSSGHVATLYSLIGLSAIIGATSLGRLSDKVGRRPVLTGSMLALALSCGLLLFGREPFATLSVLLNGSASFAYPVLVATVLRDQVSDRLFSNALGVITLIYGVSLTLGPMVAGAIGDSRVGFDLLYACMAVMAIFAAAAVSAIPGRRTSRGPVPVGS